MSNIIEKLKQSNLVGRGGACFPTWAKWEMVKKAKGEDKYVICNASEGEPGILKDKYVLEKYPDRMVEGMKVAIKFFGAKKGFIYLNPQYYKKFRDQLEKLTHAEPIEVYKKPHSAGYIGGEETSVINTLEGRRTEPRLRPPYPPTSGLWDYPTLVNNVETFYDVSLIVSGEYKNKRLYTINGDCLWTGVYDFHEDWTIEKVLKETKNYPDFDFFVQVGGDGSGEVLNSNQLRRKASGGASITVYSMLKHQPLDLINGWVDFFLAESCGQCTPCREGVYRLKEVLLASEPNWELFAEILNALQETAFCGLGYVVSTPIRTYVKNVLSKTPDNKIKLDGIKKKII